MKDIADAINSLPKGWEAKTENYYKKLKQTKQYPS